MVDIAKLFYACSSAARATGYLLTSLACQYAPAANRSPATRRHCAGDLGEAENEGSRGCRVNIDSDQIAYVDQPLSLILWLQYKSKIHVANVYYKQYR